jgi:hypothetical protein
MHAACSNWQFMGTPSTQLLAHISKASTRDMKRQSSTGRCMKLWLVPKHERKCCFLCSLQCNMRPLTTLECKTVARKQQMHLCCVCKVTTCSYSDHASSLQSVLMAGCIPCHILSQISGCADE